MSYLTQFNHKVFLQSHKLLMQVCNIVKPNNWNNLSKNSTKSLNSLLKPQDMEYSLSHPHESPFG